MVSSSLNRLFIFNIFLEFNFKSFRSFLYPFFVGEVNAESSATFVAPSAASHSRLAFSNFHRRQLTLAICNQYIEPPKGNPLPTMYSQLSILNPQSRPQGSTLSCRGYAAFFSAFKERARKKEERKKWHSKAAEKS